MIIWTLIILAAAFVSSVFLIGYFNNALIKRFVVNEQKKELLRINEITKTEKQKLITPLQLQAYERLVLFLERIEPNNLVLRCFVPTMNAQLLKDVMTKNIRDEFEHNLSQQLYISNEAWQLIKNAKEELLSVINSINANDTGNNPTAFAGKLFEQFAGKKTALELAMEVLKNEIKVKF